MERCLDVLVCTDAREAHDGGGEVGEAANERVAGSARRVATRANSEHVPHERPSR
jgi:hypothetical protein